MHLGIEEGSWRRVAFATVVLAGFTFACQNTGSSDDRPCGGGTCGFIDHHYDSTFYCPPGPFRPGGWVGYTWRDQTHCHNECAAASDFGCDASGCDAQCNSDTGSGRWLPCDAASNGTSGPGGCFLSGSGVNGETVACVCG
jgi:hypothetical protein